MYRDFQGNHECRNPSDIPSGDSKSQMCGNTMVLAHAMSLCSLPLGAEQLRGKCEVL